MPEIDNAMSSEPSTSRGHKLNIIPSQRGGRILLCNGYKYNRHTTWRCASRKCCSANYKHRNKSLETKKIRFFQLKDVCIPGKFKDLLFADYYEKSTRILVFCSKEGREFMLSYQIKNKVPTYETLFRLCKSQVPELEPEKVTTDFEISAMNAVKNVFPNAKSQGCLFHFKQAVLRNAKKNDINKSKLWKCHVRQCMALSYLPTQFVADGWLYILENQHDIFSDVRVSMIVSARHVVWDMA
ncbi:uncharacterized protein LOC114361950 [Ostrinia furnacalis]|uniref:uncharacterized protein LOC114361950 n=1 Tax=Ostrinia furnacalis TaxID=93504 RepID=UPI00103A92AF|nr:uncharacterized protein LOC114361950 [Ostrinia furnacalis]